MRVPWTILAVFSTVLLAPADTIYLKNGHTIVADRASERNGRVYYEVGASSYAIPLSLVQRIESATPAAGPASAPRSVSAAPRPSVATARPQSSAATTPDGAPPPVIHEGRVDADALAALEWAGDDSATAAGYFAAGRHEYELGDREQARVYLERALRFAPDDANILSQYATVLVQLGRAAEALPYAERATRQAPASADACTVLGFAYYRSNRTRDAVAAWRRALALRPDSALQAYIAQAEREASAEQQFSATDAGHFTFHYEGEQSSPQFREALQAELEKDYADLVRMLKITPAGPVTVSLYTDQAFFDVTQAPAWSGALNDGKLRIPVQGLPEITPDLSRVLHHELAHSFINQAARGRCPQWLNEGIAQLLEPRTLGPARGSSLARLYRIGQAHPLNTLEISFLSFSPFEAVVAYDESLAAVEYIRDTFGISKLSEILNRIGEGSSTEMALRIVIRSGYAGLQEQVARHLTLKYGK